MKKICRYVCVFIALGALLACAGCSGSSTATQQPTGTIEGTAK